MVEHGVRLERWPSGVAIPEALADRFRYDEGTHRLVYGGFMSKMDFDRLNQLCDDWGYRRALEELFREATVESVEEGQSRGALGRRLAGLLHGLGL
jgi:hypothetical protein